MRSSINLAKSTIIFWSFIIFFGLLVYWAFTFKIEKSININGLIKPLGLPIIVQNRLEGKIIDIHVKKSQIVEIGQKLVSLETELNETELFEIEMKQLTNFITILRLQTQLEQNTNFNLPQNMGFKIISENVLQNSNAIYLEQEKALLSELRALNDELIVIASERKVKAAEIRVLEGSTSALKQELDIALRQYTLIEKLFNQGFEGEIPLMEAKNAVLSAEKSIDETATKLALAKDEIEFIEKKSNSLISNFKKQTILEINQLKNEMRLLIIEKQRAQSKINELIINASTNGIISVLNVENIGQILTPGEIVAEIIPSDMPLVFYADVPDRYISEIRLGMPATILPSTFDTRAEKPISGKIIEIAPDATEEEGKEPYYEVILSFDTENDKKEKLRVGITGSASVILGDRTIIDYYFDPLIKEFRGALSE